MPFHYDPFGGAADHESEESTTTWPLPAFRFKVTIGAPVALTGSFQEVSGLDSESQPLEYRHGIVKMPGIPKIRNVTLKKGFFQDDKGLVDWQGSIAQNSIKRQTIVIELLDEMGASAMKWTLGNAFPTKIVNSEMKHDEVAVEIVELAFETFAMNVS
jgi:phage tail-like protein